MRLVFSLLAFAIVIGCADPDTEGPESDADTTVTPPPPLDEGRSSLASAVAADPRLRTLDRLLRASGLDETLADTSTTFTLFAPSDDAFARLGEDDVASLESAPEEARQVLLSHVLETRMLSVDVFPDLSIQTAAGTDLSFAETDAGLSVRSGGTTSEIVTADLDVDNGVIHIIDAVLSR